MNTPTSPTPANRRTSGFQPAQPGPPASSRPSRARRLPAGPAGRRALGVCRICDSPLLRVRRCRRRRRPPALLLLAATVLLLAPTTALAQSLQITSPYDNHHIDLGPDEDTAVLTTDVTLLLTCTTPAGIEGRILVYLDEEPVVSVDPALPNVTLPDVSAGAHTVTAYLADDRGTAYDTPTTIDVIRFFASRVCDSPADCVDDDPCTAGACIGRDDAAPWFGRCRFGVDDTDPDCCVTAEWCRHRGLTHGSPMEPSQYQCHDVDGDDVKDCVQCLEDSDCPLFSPHHASASCDGDFSCVYVTTPDSCYVPTQSINCYDANDCTIDRCDETATYCENVPIPGCCLPGREELPPDAPDFGCTPEDADPCSRFVCVGAGSSATCFQGVAHRDCCTADDDCDDVYALTLCADPDRRGHGTCRDIGSQPGSPDTGVCDYTPLAPGCCLHDYDCADRWPVELGTCVLDDGQRPGRCVYAPNPEFCDTHEDCDDGDPRTGDLCDEQRCQHVRPDGYCVTDAGCDDGQLCTVDTCDPTTRRCQHEPVGPGCCELDLDCADWYPPGVEDEAARAGFDQCAAKACVAGACRYGRDMERPGCCVPGGETPFGCVDRNYCTVDECVPDLGVDEAGATYPRCRFDLDLDGDGINDCCREPGDCYDGDPDTVDACQMNPGISEPAVNHCWYKPELCYCGPGALGSTCDDGDPCTIDACCTGLGEPLESCPSDCRCGHDRIPGCCVSDGNCTDGRVCTRDICCLGPGDPSPLCEAANTCVNEEVAEGCCETQPDCNGPGKPEEFYCRTGHCVGGVCRYGPSVDGCCREAADCGAPSACTSWACVDHVCLSQRTDGCCETAADCPEHPDPCLANVCEANRCVERVVPNCCVDDNPDGPDPDCRETPEDDPCTADYCLPGPHGTSVCRHFPAAGPGCCSSREQCPDDNVQCTRTTCEDHRCALNPVTNCLATSPYRMTFSEGNAVYAGEFEGVGDLSWSTDELGTNAASQFWSLASDGPLGSDLHLRFMPAGDVMGFEACVVLPQFRTIGATYAVLQFTWAVWDVGGAAAPVGLRVLVRNGGGWLMATEMWAQTIDASSGPTLETVPFPLTSLNTGGQGVEPQLAFCVSSTSTAELGAIGLDDIVLSRGHAPLLTPPANVSVRVGEHRIIQHAFAAANRDPDSSLRFRLIGSRPPWVSVGEARGDIVGPWTADLIIRGAECPAAGGAIPLTLEVSAGELVERARFYVVVDGCGR